MRGMPAMRAGMYLSVLTIGELIKGIAKLSDGEKGGELQSWV